MMLWPARWNNAGTRRHQPGACCWHSTMVLTGRKGKVSALPGLPESSNMRCRATASCGLIVRPPGWTALPHHGPASPDLWAGGEAGGALTAAVRSAAALLCGWKRRAWWVEAWLRQRCSRLNRKLCLAEQDVRFPGGRCLIRLLLMLTLCIFFALSPFFLYYFLLWFDVVGI